MLRNPMHPSWGSSSQQVPTPTCWSRAARQLWPDGSLCSTVGRICNGWGCLPHPRCLNKCNLKLPCQGDQHAKAFGQKCHQALVVGSGGQNLCCYLCELLIFLLHFSNAESSVLSSSPIYTPNTTPLCQLQCVVMSRLRDTDVSTGNKTGSSRNKAHCHCSFVPRQQLADKEQHLSLRHVVPRWQQRSLRAPVCWMDGEALQPASTSLGSSAALLCKRSQMPFTAQLEKSQISLFHSSHSAQQLWPAKSDSERIGGHENPINQ